MAPVQPMPPTTLPHTLPVVIPVPATTPLPPPSFLSRTQRFIEENQNLLILGAAVLAAGGGYYYYTTREDVPGRGDGGAGLGKKNKKKNKGKKGLKGEGTDGPLLEEITPRETVEKAGQGGEEVKQGGGEETPVEDEDIQLKNVPEGEALTAMSASERDALGTELKVKGNQLYTRKEYKRAAEYYTKAIEVSVRVDSVFFSNRAAAYGNFSPPEWEKVIADCDEALKIDMKYTKALKRRAAALEHLGRDEEALNDYTAFSVLTEFRKGTNPDPMERCLHRVAAKRGKEMFESREPKLASPTFISQYLSSFRPHAKPTLPENPSQGDQTLILAFDAVEAADYIHAVSFTNEAIEQGISPQWTEGRAEAYNLRATFKFMMSDTEGAKTDFEKSLEIKPDLVQSWVKIASVHMELGEAAGAFGDFEAAIRHNADDPDIYYHRGQVYFINSEYDKAIADYHKSTQLDDTFIFTHIQHAVATYKKDGPGDKMRAMAAFRQIMKRFPDRGEPNNYYGELLLDQGKFEESIERFDKSIELDKHRKPRNVIPIVNKAMAIFQWKEDNKQSSALCEEVLKIDPECDIAVGTLAQLSMQDARTDDAIRYLQRSAVLARTEQEIVTALTYEYASRAQKEFVKNYPDHRGPFGVSAQDLQ